MSADRYAEASLVLAFPVYSVTQIRSADNALQSYPMPGWFWKAATMKTTKTNYIRVRALHRVNQLACFGWQIKNSTLGRASIIIEMFKPGRRLIVTSPL